MRCINIDNILFASGASCLATLTLVTGYDQMFAGQHSSSELLDNIRIATFAGAGIVGVSVFSVLLLEAINATIGALVGEENSDSNNTPLSKKNKNNGCLP